MLDDTLIADEAARSAIPDSTGLTEMSCRPTPRK
jgi:hypothetical protein